MMARHKLTHHEYTVGWICALPIELKAACAILDKVHETLPPADHDDNVYTLGKVAQHNVVITCLPKGIYGTTQAANVAQRMELSFPNIQYRLMVGVGGGVPSPSDVRLGDVVIGVPGANSTGIVAYDHGKTTVGGHLEQTVILNKPPLNLLKAVPHLGLGRVSSIGQTLKTAIASDSTALAEFAYPGEENDRLFQAEYDHPDPGQSCPGCCNGTKILQRPQRECDEPHIHAGTIGSGNQVIKDARTRDSLAKAYGILCFEMEAAGLVDSWPCLVIRGICDYSDSHKQKQWQPYAAITAAACARSLLLLLEGKPRLYHQHPEIDDAPPAFLNARKECLQRLSFSNPIQHREDLQERKGRRAKGTCEWMLKTNIFQEWLGGSGKDDSNILWLHGLPATGKSMMTIFLTEALENDTNLGNVGLVIYFFCDSSSQNHTSGIAVLSGLIWQLIKDRPKSQEMVRIWYEENKGLFTSFNRLWKLFITLLNGWSEGKIYCVIDALDECDAESQNAMLRKFESFFDPEYYDRSVSHVYFLITSRPYEEIRTYLGGFVNANLGGFPEAKDDVAAFIEYSVGRLTEKKRFSDELQGRVRHIVQEKAEDTFLWVSLAMEEVKDAARADIIEILEQLPAGLSSLYGQLLQRATQASPERKEDILRIVNVVAVSLKPLSLLQLAYASQLYAEESEEERSLAMRSSIGDCKLLVVETNDKVALLHKSVKDFLADDRYNNGVGLWATHSFLAYRCIDCCMESVGISIFVSKFGDYEDEEIDHTSLLGYSTRFWPEHAHFAGDHFEIIENQEPFFKENSLQWQNWWSRLSASRIYRKWGKHSPFHIAVIWGILPLVKYVLRTTAVERYRRTEYLDTDFLTQKGETALELAAKSGHEMIVCHLLGQAPAEMLIFRGVLEAAIKNTQRGAQIIDALLLHPRAHKSNWNHSHLVEAAKNPICGREILQSLLKHIPKLRGSLDDEILAAAAENSDLQPMRLLLNFSAGNINLSEKVLLKAARNKASGYNMTLVLLSSGITISITERIISAAVNNTRQGTSILKLLLGHYNGKISATTLNWAAQDGKDRANLLLQHASGIEISSSDIETFQSLDPKTATDMIRTMFVEDRPRNVVTGSILSACCRHLTGAQLSLILERRENRQQFTSRLFASALKNERDCIAVMESLQKYWEGPIPFTPKVLERLMKFNGNYRVINYVWGHTNTAKADISIGRWRCIFMREKGLKNVQALLDRDGGVMNIKRHDLYGAWDKARHTSSSWNQILQWALDHPRDKLHITPRAMELILRFWSKPTVRALLKQNQSQISFHEEALKIIVERFDQSDLLTVLNGLQKPLSVTEGILIAASRNGHCHREMLRILIDRMGGNVSVTPNILRAIARADEGSLELLMSRNDSCFEISEDVVIEVFENDQNDSKMMRTLLSRNKEKREITYRAAVAIVAIYDATTVELLLRHYIITSLSNNIIVAALFNRIDSVDILEMLLKQSSDWVFDQTLWSSFTRECSQNTFHWLNDRLSGNNVTSKYCLEGALSNPRLSFPLLCQLLDLIPAHKQTCQRLVACSARNQTHSRRLVEFVLAKNDTQLIFITEDLVGGLGIQRLCDLAMKELLSIDSNRIKITQHGVHAILRWYDQSTVDCLIKKMGTDFHFTDDLVQALILNPTYDQHSVHRLLLERKIQISSSQLSTIIERRCFNIDILKQTLADPLMRMTEGLFESIAAAEDGYSMMDAYLNTHSIGSIRITVPAIVNMIGTPHRDNLPLLKMLLRKPRIQVSLSQPVIRAGLLAFSAHGQETFEHCIEILTLLVTRGDKIITDEECMAVLFAHKHAKRFLEAICHHTSEQELIISNNMVKSLKRYSAIQTLADHAKFRVLITEAAMCNIVARSGYEIDIHWLISQPNWKIPITEIVLCAGLMKGDYGLPHISALLQHASHVQLTSVFFKILTEAEVATRKHEDSTEYIEGFLSFFKKVRFAGCTRADMVDGIVEHCSPTIVLALLDRIDDPIPLSRETLPLIASRFSEKIIAVFLDRHGDNSLITEEVLAAAASNDKHGPDVVALLLQRSVVLPTEAVLLAAATNITQGLPVLTILFDHLSRISGKIVDTDRKNHWGVWGSILSKKVIFAALETCFADHITQYRSWGGIFPCASVQDQAMQIIAMLIERGVSVVFNEDDLLRLFELYTLAPQFPLILQIHKGKLPTITSTLVAKVQSRVTKYPYHNVFSSYPNHNPTLHDPLLVPAVKLTVSSNDPLTFNFLMRWSDRPSEELRAVVESCSGQWIGKQTMLQLLNDQETKITREMISKGALGHFDSFELFRKPEVRITRDAFERILRYLDPWHSWELLELKCMGEIIDEETWSFMVSKFTDLDTSRLDLSLLDLEEVIEKSGRREMISESILSSIISTKNYVLVELCLKNYHKPLVVTQQLVNAFAAPDRFSLRSRRRPDVNIMRRLLEHESLAHSIHPSSFKRILEIFGSGIADELFKITKNRLLVDESLLVSIISTKNMKTIKSFFKEYQADLTLTPRIVVVALQTNAPDHVEAADDDESDNSDETSEDSPDWPESDRGYDSHSSSGYRREFKYDRHWHAEPQVPNDERDVDDLKMDEDTNTEYCNSAYLFEYLLRYCSYDPAGLTESILLSVVENPGECEALFMIIAKYYSLENVRITENIAKASATNSMRSVQLLLDLFPGKVPITEEVLIAAARSSKEIYETLRLLLSCSSRQISVTEKVMTALLRNHNSSLAAFRLVLEYGGSNLLRSQEIKTSLVRNAKRSFVLQFFLEQPEFSLTVTERMIRPDNENDGKPGESLESTDILSKKKNHFPAMRKRPRWDSENDRNSEERLMSSNILFKGRNVRFTPAAIAFIMAKTDTGTSMSLLEKLAIDRQEHYLTEDVFLHALSNEHETACFMIHHILSRTSKYITEKAWIAAAKNTVNGWTLMQIFADYDSTLESMAPMVLLHAARNEKLGHHILKWLLSYHPTKVYFSEDILGAISGNPVWWTGGPLTSETYRPHLWQNGPILEVMLHRAQEKAEITEEVLISAARNPEHSARYVRVLLQHPTRQALNLQNVTRIAAAQDFVDIKTLLNLFQHGARVDEDIVVAAMRNSKGGGDIFELFRVENLWADFVATERTVFAAAENGKNGNELLEDFLSSYQGVIVCQDEHIQKVASSFNSDVLRQLRIRQMLPVSNQLPVFVYFHYIFCVLCRWFVLYC